MIKIPATPQGIPAIEEVIAAGVNVNVTLIFSVENYIQVAEAYIKGLERRLEAGQNVKGIASVASFFVSRIDAAVEKLLGDDNKELMGKVAIANAQLAYLKFKDLFYGERFVNLRKAGAWVQRPLWASTGVKNPDYSDTLYLDTLIAKDTVNTVPPATLDAFKDHGTAERETILDGIDDAQAVFDKLAAAGVNIDNVTQKLQDDGVDAFAKSFGDLLNQVGAKRDKLDTVRFRQKFALSGYVDAMHAALDSLIADDFNNQLWAHKGSAFKSDAETIAKIENRLGWLDVLDTIDIERLKTLQSNIKDGDFDHVVLLGMGGSSLCPEVLYQTFGSGEGFPELLMLDSTHPQQVKRVEDAIDMSKTLFIVASKSGGTIETLSFQKYFFAKSGENGSQFMAITDSGSKLERIAADKGFRDCFINPSDIGGRYSALSYFGMVPAALIGIDLDRFWNEATTMMNACKTNDSTNPALSLGAVIAGLGEKGRDKIVIFASDSIHSFGNWVEQLVAESVGKEGKGFLPIVGSEVGRPNDYDADRLFVYLKVKGDPSNEERDTNVRRLREAAQPRVTLMLNDKYALAGEFFRWEYATAVAGKLLNINPFDEPNVTESKQNTGRLLDYYKEHGKLPNTEPVLSADGVSLFAGKSTATLLKELGAKHHYDINNPIELLAAQIAGTGSGDYFALLAYIPTTPEIDEILEEIRLRLRNVTKRATTVGYGPRYLHSTGQFHKGGPNRGIFFQITADQTTDLEIPDTPYGFAVLNDAQAAGDIEALEAHDCRAIRIHIHGDIVEGIEKLVDAVDFVDVRRH